MGDSQRPVLLFDATFSGTLAAVRSLGRAGARVTVADSGLTAPAFWSRYASRHLRCPPVTDTRAFVDWMVRFGDRHERHVLYPTSDELIYLLAAHRDELSSRFALYQPELSVVMQILDKKLLYEAAHDVGLETPRTWFPESPDEVESAAGEADAPLMIKPRTQAFLLKHPKGQVGPRNPRELRVAYERFCSACSYSPVPGRPADLARPMLQRYYAEAADSIYSVTGFRDATGKHLALLGSTKVLQRPRRIGIGLCFESTPLPAALALGVGRLLRRLGHHGVFELEFVRVGAQLLLIDMNPRFFHHMALDAARGLDLPRLAYTAAQGDELELARLVASAPSAEVAEHAFCDGVGLRLLVGAQRLFGAMSAAEARRWSDWRREHDGTLVDAVSSQDDPGPLLAEILAQSYRTVRHPRAFLRMIALDR